MSAPLYVRGPSRAGDRTFTWASIHSAISAAPRHELFTLLAKVELALGCVQALHTGSTKWEAWRVADRAWWSLYAVTDQMAPPAVQAQVRAKVESALKALAVRLAEADVQEVTAEKVWAMSEGSQ